VPLLISDLLAGEIACPHFGQLTEREAFIFSRLIFRFAALSHPPGQSNSDSTAQTFEKGPIGLLKPPAPSERRVLRTAAIVTRKRSHSVSRRTRPVFGSRKELRCSDPATILDTPISLPMARNVNDTLVQPE
jgi:hypothetical protein